MSKIGVIDIGSNSVRMVVFDAMARAPHYVFNEKAMCKLGEGFTQTGKLSKAGVVMAKDTLARFVYLANAMRVSNLEVVGTAALREASDGPKFVQWVEETLKVKLRILAGEEEARISAQGVLLGWPDADGLICDIGGSSMELIEVKDGAIGRRISLPLGPLRLGGLSEKELSKTIETTLSDAFAFFSKSYARIYLVGGSWRALAKLNMHRKKYPFPILHEYEVDPKQMVKTIEVISKLSIEEMNAISGTSLARLELIPQAGMVLKGLIKAFKPETLAVSAYGLREGLLYENMPNWMRSSDPLITASQELEKQFARFPGFGLKLKNWLSPLLEKYDTRTARLAEAACYLHDTNWRYHPDFRAQMSFEIVAQANICGINHEDRLFLALALASRYENNSLHANAHPAIALLTAERAETARELGRAIRLGSMISAATSELLEQTALELKSGMWVLKISESLKSIYGDSVNKRLSALGQISGRNVKIEFI